MGILLDILSGVGNTLDVPGSMVRDTLGGENPFDQLMTPWRANNRLSGRDLNRRWGLAGSQDTWGNAIGGIATELLTDPMNLLAGAGAINRALKGAKIAKATQAVDQANTLSQALRAKGWMPEEVAAATKIRWPGDPAAPWEVFDPTTGNVVSKFADELSASRAASGRPLDYAKVPVGPRMKVHETAAPVFGSHEFLPDPGTNNWLGKGTYTANPGETGGQYAKWDKSVTIMPKEPGAYIPAAGPHAIIETFKKHMPSDYFKNITPELERSHLPQIGAVALEHPQGYPKSLVEALRPMYKSNNFAWSVSAANDDASALLKKTIGMTDDQLDELSNDELWDLATKHGWTKPRLLGDKVIEETGKQSAPRTMMSFVDSRNPYTFEEPATFKDMLMGARATRQGGDSARKIREIARQHGLKVPKMQDEFVSAMRAAIKKPKQSTVDELMSQRARLDEAIDGAYQFGDDVDVREAERAWKEVDDKIQSIMYGEKIPLTKGDIWALLRSEGKAPDEITDILREAGYDALQHEPGTGTRIQERMYDIGREAPDIDEHSELVAFSPSQIYEPFIAPALKARPEQLKRIPKSLVAALAGYQAGVAPARGRSQE